MVMARVCAIACGHEDAIDLDRLRHDPLMKVAVGLDACLHAVGPGSFDQGASRVKIAGLCDPTSAHRAPTRML
jgi:hypothetical protein